MYWPFKSAVVVQVPLMLRRLRELQDKDAKSRPEFKRPSPRKMASEPLLPLDEEAVDGGFQIAPSPPANDMGAKDREEEQEDGEEHQEEAENQVDKRLEGGASAWRKTDREGERKAKQKLNFSLPEPDRSFSELSNSSWSETSPWVIGNNYHLYPLSPAIEQRLILQYLTPLGEYQEVSAEPDPAPFSPLSLPLSPLPLPPASSLLTNECKT